MTSYIKYIGAKAVITHFVEAIVSEMANIAWVQADVEEENKQDGQEINLHQYVDLGQGDNLSMTKNMLRNAHSQCENMLEGLLLPIEPEFMSMDNMKSEEECFLTEIRVPQHMRQSDVELICYTMHQYMMHYALYKWALWTAPNYAQQWGDAMMADGATLKKLNGKRNRVVTQRAMSVM